MPERLKKLKTRADRVRERLTEAQKISLSVSYVLFGLAIYILILLSFADSLGYGQNTKFLFVISFAGSFVVSYLLYRQVRDVDLLDYIAFALFPHAGKPEHHDSTAGLLFFGLVLVATTPLVYSYTGSTFITSTSLLIGGLLVALSVVGYVVSAREA